MVHASKELGTRNVEFCNIHLPLTDGLAVTVGDQKPIQGLWSDAAEPFLSRITSSRDSLIGADKRLFETEDTFLKPPPKQRRPKKKKKKNEKCRAKGSGKTIDSIPASIPEENSEELLSSDPDIETVEYTKTRKISENMDFEEMNQNTVHSVHQIFSEMDELVQDQGEDVWEEKARWIKFEQDVCKGADRWSKPHVTTLKLQSVIALRRCIENGTVLLGMKAFNLESVIEMTLDRLVSRALITSSVASQLRALLLKRHIHTGEHAHEAVLMFRRARARKNGKLDLLGKISEGISPEISPAASRINSRTNSEQDLVKLKHHFLRKLPADTEASNVMIGKLDYLDNPICVTIRLSHSILLGDVTEVPIPTRFIFLLLCPTESNIDHVEVGRAASTLFSDEMFYKAAYSATSKAHMVEGIDRFLEKAIVIPPGEWNPRMKITLPEEEDSEAGELRETEEKESGNQPPQHAHVMPLGGFLCDLKALRRRWLADWKRGFNLLPLISPLQFAPIVFCYTMLLLKLAQPHISFPIPLSLYGVGTMLLLTSLLGCQPLAVTSISLSTILWEMAAQALCQQIGVNHASIRPVLGLTAGLLLMAASLLNANNLLPRISVFVYETVVAAFPIALLFVVLIALARFPPESQILMCSAVIILVALLFLNIWQHMVTSTIFTKKIRSVMGMFNIIFLLLLSAILVYFLPTPPSVTHRPSLNFSSTNLTFVLPNGHERLPFADDYFAIFTGIFLGIVLTLLVVLLFSLVYSWIEQPSHKVKRVNGKFWDQCLVALGFLLSGMYSLPFLVPDLVLTPVLLHLLSVTSASTPDLIYVREQRVTLTLSSVLVIMLALGVSHLHVVIPLPLCWGVVLFYCLTGCRHTQLFERCKILLQSEKYHPDKSYVENTPLKVINSYTIVQVVIVGAVVVVMVTPFTCAALPFFIVLLILTRRHFLPWILFEDLINLMENSSDNSMGQLPCEMTSRSLADTDKVEFSEEVTKITNGCAAERLDSPVSPIRETSPPPVLSRNPTDQQPLLPEQVEDVERGEVEMGDVRRDTGGAVFPQIIFDNLTDEDTAHTTNKTMYSEPDLFLQPIGLSLTPPQGAGGALDFMNRRTASPTCPFTHQDSHSDLEEPVRSGNGRYNIHSSTCFDEHSLGSGSIAGT